MGFTCSYALGACLSSCLFILLTYVLYMITCFSYLRTFVSLFFSGLTFFTCLTCLYFYTWLTSLCFFTCLHFLCVLHALIFACLTYLHFFTCFHFFMCLTYPHFLTCFLYINFLLRTCLHFFKYFHFLHSFIFLRVFIFIMRLNFIYVLAFAVLIYLHTFYVPLFLSSAFSFSCTLLAWPFTYFTLLHLFLSNSKGQKVVLIDFFYFSRPLRASLRFILGF